MSPMENLDEIVRALEWAKRTGRLEYTRRTNLNGDYCDGVDAFDRALTLARELREDAVEAWLAFGQTDGVRTWWGFERPPSFPAQQQAALLILSDPTP